jgi:hypothetical protein
MVLGERSVLARDLLRLRRAGCGAGRSRRGSGGRLLRARWRLLLRTLLRRFEVWQWVVGCSDGSDDDYYYPTAMKTIDCDTRLMPGWMAMVSAPPDAAGSRCWMGG